MEMMKNMRRRGKIKRRREIMSNVISEEPDLASQPNNTLTAWYNQTQLWQKPGQTLKLTHE